MNSNWLNKDDIIHLPRLFVHFGYEAEVEGKDHILFKRNSQCRVVIFTENGFKYYKVENPEKKYSSSSLILEEVAKVEGISKETIWDKVTEYYQKVLDTDNLLVNDTGDINLVKVTLDFNHFLSYKIPFNTQQGGLYSTENVIGCFENRIFQTKSGEPIFPLFNNDNQITGYLIDEGDMIRPYKESYTDQSIWFSNVPTTIEWFILFNNPKEALSFHTKFSLTNAVYCVPGKINYDTTAMLLNIQREMKVKKLVLTFTGRSKIEGYLRDLTFISFMEKRNFMLNVHGSELRIEINKIDEKSPDFKSFVDFYNGTKNFNQGLAKSFLKYNKILDQQLLNEHSILLKKEDDFYSIRVPFEVNALKYFVWSYNKNFLGNSIEIIKPRQRSWFLDWESSQSLTIKRKEEVLKEYKIAL